MMFDNIWDKILEENQREILKELISTEKIKYPVLICNKKNKFVLRQIMPNAYILAAELCDDKVYMVTDETIADNIREILKYDNK